MKKEIIILLLTLLFISACQRSKSPITIDISSNWRFSPDENNIGTSESWYSINFDDSDWAVIDAGKRWEDLGYRELDGFGWYRKTFEIPADWKGKKIWLRIEAVNDAYELFINGKSVSYFGSANISVATRPTFTEISKNVKYGESNVVAIQVNDWGNSGGLWRLPVILTTDEEKATSIFNPMSDTCYTAESLGYQLVWEDDFDGDKLDPDKWDYRGTGPRRIGYNSPDAVKIHDGFLELLAIESGDSVKAGMISTMNRFMPTFGYFECRAQLQKSKGVWAAFWIQSPKISQGEDPATFGTEIDIFEYFKEAGEDMIMHNLHWAYGPNQKTIGGRQSHVEGLHEGFHTFALEWTPEKYAFFVDGYKFYEIKEAISHIEEEIILSMEIPATIEALKETVFPDTFKIDWVRVYQKK